MRRRLGSDTCAKAAPRHTSTRVLGSFTPGALSPTCCRRCGCLTPAAGARRHASGLSVLRAVSTKRGEVLLIADTLGKTHDGEKQLFEVSTGTGCSTAKPPGMLLP